MGYIWNVTHTVPSDANVCSTKKDDIGPLPYLHGAMMAQVSPLNPTPQCVSTGAVTPFVVFYGLFEFEVWDVEEYLIPYVGQQELSYVSVKGWIIDPYVHSLPGAPDRCSQHWGQGCRGHNCAIIAPGRYGDGSV